MPKSHKLSRTTKINVNLSVDKDINELFKKLTIKEIVVNDNKVVITKTLTDVYNRALEFSLEHIDKWWT